GTGKTLAYLVPAILSSLKVVVSTGTKNLQEQILKKDIPLLQGALDVPFTAASLKGISNYLCRRKLRDFAAMQYALGEDTAALREAWPTAQLLPAYEAVIFDEAHQLEDVATDYFAISVSSLRLGRLVHDLELALGRAHLDARLDRLPRHLDAMAEALFAALRP